MPTRPPHVDVLGMPWAELVARVAQVAATGDRAARARLERMVDCERRARSEGREDPGVIARLLARAVLDPRHRPASGEASIDRRAQ